VLLQRLGVLVEEVSKGSRVRLNGGQPLAPLVTALAVPLLIEQLRAAEGVRARPARPVLQGVPLIEALILR
jgi:hypothetical protein